MIVSPFGRMRFCAVLGGNVIPALLSPAVALRLALNIPPHQSASGVAIQLRELRCRRRPIERNVRIRTLFGLERFHKRLVKIEDVLEILNRIFLRLPENPGADQVENHVADIFARPMSISSNFSVESGIVGTSGAARPDAPA